MYLMSGLTREWFWDDDENTFWKQYLIRLTGDAAYYYDMTGIEVGKSKESDQSWYCRTP